MIGRRWHREGRGGIFNRGDAVLIIIARIKHFRDDHFKDPCGIAVTEGLQ